MLSCNVFYNVDFGKNLEHLTKNFAFGYIWYCNYSSSNSSLNELAMAPSPHCKCGASKQTANLILIACPIHQATHGA